MTIIIAPWLEAHINRVGWRARAKACTNREDRVFAVRQALAWRAEARKRLAYEPARRLAQALAEEERERQEYERLRAKFEGKP